MNGPKVWMNGGFVDSKDAKVSVFDRGFLYGDGAFETMRAYAGVIFRLDAHLNRIFGALRLLEIKIPYSRQYLKDCVCRTVRANGLKSAYVRLTVTRGEGKAGIGCNGSFRPTVVIAARELKEHPERLRTGGISVRTSGIRQNERSPVSGIKSLNFLNYILARLEAGGGPFAEAVLLNTAGRVAESATGNIFLVKGHAVITPSTDSGILPGITRGVVIGIAEKLKLKIKEKAVSYEELMSADEVFLTNSLVEILPVTRVDSEKIGTGLPGEITKLLHISYQKEVIREVLKTPGPA